MTASILTQLPLMAGSAMLAQSARAVHWALGRYMQTPLTSTAILALVSMSAWAGSNALYFQTTMHPSPFFAPDRAVPLSIQPEAPMPAPVSQREQASEVAVPAPVSVPQPETTGSVSNAPQAIPDQPVGNKEVFAVQKKLAELNLFSGKVDGYYGPMTAQAIRAFEERNGMTPLGALSSQIVTTILGSDASGRTNSVPKPQAAVVPTPAPVAPAAPEPVQYQPVIQPQPTQLVASVEQDQVVARLPPLSPVEQAVDQVGSAAALTIDSIVAAVDGVRSPAGQVANPPIPTASLPTTQTTVQPTPAALVAPAETTQLATTGGSGPARALQPASDQVLVAEIQRGLASLGFFRGTIDGNPGPETARAIREFENFHRYEITGKVQPDLVDLLRNAGAAI